MPTELAKWVVGLGYSPLLILAVIIGIYLFLGCIMEETFKGIVPLLMSDAFRILLIVFVPSIALVALRF